jgi:hypothetical protein
MPVIDSPPQVQADNHRYHARWHRGEAAGALAGFLLAAGCVPMALPSVAGALILGLIAAWFLCCLTRSVRQWRRHLRLAAWQDRRPDPDQIARLTAELDELDQAIAQLDELNPDITT